MESGSDIMTIVFGFLYMQLVHTVMESFDIDKDGFLNFKEFCCLMHNAGLQYNL
jgi:Ca2+-binding EF-hand superfamily protein